MVQRYTKRGDSVTTTFTRSEASSTGFIENVTLEWPKDRKPLELEPRSVEKLWPATIRI